MKRISIVVRDADKKTSIEGIEDIIDEIKKMEEKEMKERAEFETEQEQEQEQQARAIAESFVEFLDELFDNTICKNCDCKDCEEDCDEDCDYESPYEEEDETEDEHINVNGQYYLVAKSVRKDVELYLSRHSKEEIDKTVVKNEHLYTTQNGIKAYILDKMFAECVEKGYTLEEYRLADKFRTRTENDNLTVEEVLIVQETLDTHGIDLFGEDGVS